MYSCCCCVAVYVNLLEVKRGFERTPSNPPPLPTCLTIEKEANLSVNQPPYAEVQTEAPPNVPSKSEELVEYLN